MYIHTHSTPSYLPSSSAATSTAHLTYSLQNTHLGSTGAGLAIHQPFSIHPPPPGPHLCTHVQHARLQLPSEICKFSFFQSHTVHRSGLTPRHSPQLKTPKRSGSSPSLPAAPTPPLPLATLMGSPDTHLPLRGDPHQARRHAKAQAATVLAPAKGSPTEGPTQAFGQQGRPPDITGLAGSEPGLPGQRPALTNSPPLPACTATPKDGPKGAQAQTGSFLSPSDNLTSKRGTQTPTEHTQRERPGLKTGLAGWQQGGEGGNAMEGAAPHARHTSKAQTSLRGLPGNRAPSSQRTRKPHHTSATG